MTTNLRNPGRTVGHLYLEREQTGDAIFLVEGQRIRAHRSILGAISPKYKAQFYGEYRDEGEIRVPNVLVAEFNVFLQFFYKETVDLTMDNIEAVLVLAQQSLVDKFVESCSEFLMKAIQTDKLHMVCGLADFYDIKSLRLACEKRIIAKTCDVFGSDEFELWDRGMLLFILKLDTLNCDEIYLFYACRKWAQAECERTNLDPKKPENLRAALGDVVYQIRFSSFTVEKLTDLHISMDGFFTADETKELFYMAGKKNFYKPKLFNWTPRTKGCEPNVRTVAWSNEIDRFTKLTKLEKKIDLSGRSTLSFTCSKPIRLHGFAFGIHFKNTNPSYFPMTVTVGTGDPINSKHKVYQSTDRKNETLITFIKPIKNVTRFSATIVIPFKQLNYEFVLKPDAQSTTNGHATFRFGSGSADKWLTRLFFDD